MATPHLNSRAAPWVAAAMFLSRYPALKGDGGRWISSERRGKTGGARPASRWDKYYFPRIMLVRQT
jgi:hypothetical protein